MVLDAMFATPPMIRSVSSIGFDNTTQRLVGRSIQMTLRRCRLPPSNAYSSFTTTLNY